MTRIWAALRQHAWLFLVLLVPLIVFVLMTSDTYATAAFGVFVFLAGMVFAVVFPAHPLRNGTILGVVASLIALPIAGLMRQMLGNVSLAPGETWFSSLIEAPFWLVVFAPGIVVVAFLGAALVYLMRTSQGASAAR